MIGAFCLPGPATDVPPRWTTPTLLPANLTSTRPAIRLKTSDSRRSPSRKHAARRTSPQGAARNSVEPNQRQRPASPHAGPIRADFGLLAAARLKRTAQPLGELRNNSPKTCQESTENQPNVHFLCLGTPGAEGETSYFAKQSLRNIASVAARPQAMPPNKRCKQNCRGRNPRSLQKSGTPAQVHPTRVASDCNRGAQEGRWTTGFSLPNAQDRRFNLSRYNIHAGQVSPLQC